MRKAFKEELYPTPMAKRRREKDEEEDKPFKIPKFDEEKFLKRERRNIKTTFISVLFGLLMAFVCFGFWALMGKQTSMRWPLVLLVAIANMAFLRYVFLRLNIDLTDFGRKNWFTSYAFYFIAWLIFFIILVNPPVYDEEIPRVELVVLPEMQELGGTVKIVAKITDNVGIEKGNIQFSIMDPGGNASSPDFTYQDTIFYYEYQSPSSLSSDIDEYTYTLTVTDGSGLTNEKTGIFSYSNDTIKLPDPQKANERPGADVTYTTPIIFDVGPSVSRVYYTVNDSSPINASYDADEGYYKTTPKMEGWVPDQNNVTVKVYAEIIYYFINSLEDYNNTIVDTNEYYFIVADNYDIGDDEPPEIALPQPYGHYIPGFELLLFLVSLIIVAIIFKYHKKNKRSKK
jgi:hypothetical protein